MKDNLLWILLILILFPVSTLSQSDDWIPPSFSERQGERNDMVEEQLLARDIKDHDVLEAMRSVPRHRFVPESLQDRAYDDTPLPIGHGQTISQPYIVAFMTQSLNLDYNDNVLEIGTGSGYQAAVLSHLTPHIYSIEIVEALGNRAKEDLSKLGYTNIHLKIGDGYFGWDKYEPFDAIIVTAAPEDIPSPLLEQLKNGGTLVVPVGKSGEIQTFVKVSKTASGEIKKQRLMAVRFVPMTGEAQN